MKRVLMVGCGDVALRVAQLLDSRYRLYGLLRNVARIEELRAHNIMPLIGNLDERRSLLRISGLADIVFHFAPPPPCGVVDMRTRNLLASLSRNKLPQRLIYISTSGVYGDRNGVLVNETDAVKPQSGRARRRLDAEQYIRKWAQRNAVTAIILRVPGIYAAGRLPLEYLRSGKPVIVSAEDSYVNHIHADDLARIAVAAMRYGAPGRVYHACDDSELLFGDYFDAVADAMHLARPSRMPRAEIRHAVSAAMYSYMDESRRLSNERIKRELQFKLRYPTVAQGLAGLDAEKQDY